ncbi:MAG: sugar ABC transporter ATP-binding protein [Candidatus Latescibacteria bacterium]|nr:sugar ABC transporter ATP-binding protein [Candidatus Latescibacterota bacterium]
MAAEPLVQLRDIHKQYPGVYALKGVDFELCPGEVHALVGENGAGKSTLIKILAGACPFDRGEYLIGGEPAGIASPQDAIRRGISVVYQELELAPRLSVAENIFFGRLPSRRGQVQWAQLYQESAAVLEQVGLEVDPRLWVERLGLAAQQLVEIARALSCRARVLIMDEPTSALTPAEISRLFGLIRRLREQGTAILYVSHKLEEILSLADRVTVLRDGARVGTLQAGSFDEAQLIALMVGRPLGALFPRTHRARGAAALEVKELSTARVHDISFRVARGEIVGFSGLMGAGRTEVARAVLGLDRRLGGEVRVGGQALPADSCAAARRLGLGLVPEDRRAEGIFPQLGVDHNASIASLEQFSRRGWIRREQEQEAVAEQVRRLEIRTPSLAQRIALLSGGNQQKVLIARWLLRQGLRALLVDEPTRGIDVGARAEIYRLLDLLAGQGLGLVVISSELPELLGLCDRIYVMKGGRITGVVERAQATQEKLLAMAL